MKKHKKKLLIFTVITVSALVFVLLAQTVFILTSPFIVRVGFRGLENLFHVPNEYYAISDFGTHRISGILAKAILGEEIENRKIYDDTETRYWFASLEYAPDGTSFTQGDWIETKFGGDYRLLYNNWTRNTPAPNENDLKVMLSAAESLHSGAPEEWSWQGGGTIGLTSFMLIKNGNDYLLVQDDNQLFHVSENGSFKHLMERPKRGSFDYYIFR